MRVARAGSHAEPEAVMPRTRRSHSRMTWGVVVGGVLSLAAAGLTVLPAASQQIPQIEVDAVHDAADGDPTDGICATAEVVPACTLRAAVQEANARPGEELIELADDATYLLSIPGGGEDAAATGDLDVTDRLWLSGNGSTISAAGLGDRVVDVVGGDGWLELGDATLTGGEAPAGEGGGALRVRGNTAYLRSVNVLDNRAQDGGGLWADSGDIGEAELGVYNDSIVGNNTAVGRGGGILAGEGVTARVSGSLVTANVAESGAGLWLGHVDGVALPDTDGIELDLDFSVVEGNEASLAGGGIFFGGNIGELEIESSELTGNTAADGGGLWAGPVLDDVSELRVEIVSTLIAENHAGRYEVDGDEEGGVGGGLWLGYLDEGYLRDVTVLGNSADENGGGIALYGGHLDVGWSTIADNQAEDGGGLYRSDANESSPGGQDRPMRLVNTTVSGNAAERGAGLDLESDSEVLLDHVTVLANDSEAGIHLDEAGPFEVRGSIVLGCEDDDARLTSLGYNLTSAACLESSTTGDVESTGTTAEDLGLTGLQDNGGWTGHWPGRADDDELEGREGSYEWVGSGVLTHAPVDSTSPAVDAAHPDSCPQTDQRLVPRPVYAGCDIGAVEYSAEVADPVISFISGWEPVEAGTEFSYEVEIWNYGPDTAVETVFTVDLPVGVGELVFLEADPECLGPDPDGVLTCTVENLAGGYYEDGARDTVTILVRAPDAASGGDPMTVFADIVATTPVDADPNDYSNRSEVSTTVYEVVDPDPDPDSWLDTDGDRVHDEIDPRHDLGPLEPFNSYGQYRFSELDTSTHGRILDRAGHDIFVDRDPEPTPGQPGRVRITVLGEDDSTQPALVEACRTMLRMLPDSAVVVRCGSLDIEVLEGAAEVVLADGTVVQVPAGVTAYIDEREDGTVLVEHRGGEGAITVLSNGQVQTLEPGERISTIHPQAPLSAAPALNDVKAGSNVPLKWTLVNDDGTPVTSPTNVTASLTRLDCQTGELAGDPVGVAMSGPKNQGEGRYHLNWKTPKSYSGTCQALTLDLGEGRQLTVQFAFR